MREALERRFAELLDEGALHEAATEALEGYGDAVLRFLMRRTNDEDRAAEAFAQMSEDLWRSLPDFRGECALMTWMFTLARNAERRRSRRVHNRPERHATLSALAAITARIRERTAGYLRTDVKDRFRAIRASLSEDERTLLHLRLDEELPWLEVARVMEGRDLDPTEGRRVSARLRKRYDRLREKLRALAEAEGLLEPREETR